RPGAGGMSEQRERGPERPGRRPGAGGMSEQRERPLEQQQWADPLEEMRYALAEGDAATPPAGLQATVQTAALQTRAAGRPSPGAHDITPLEAYRRSAITVDQLVDALTDDEWRRHALRDMDVQGLIGHLIGVEHHFRAGAGLGDPIEEAEHHIASTQPFV